MDCSQVTAKLVEWIQDQVHAAGAKGIVVGLSGGVDSAVVGALAKRAFPDNVLGLILPAHSHPDDIHDAMAVAEAFDIPVRTIDLGPLYDLALAVFNPDGENEKRKSGSSQRIPLAEANLKPRLRMMAWYYFANRLDYLVAGTGNRSEREIGYFTKYGDGGVDILPIGGLVKTQVWELASFLGVPEQIITKAPSAGLWAGQTDEGEMGITYEALDRYLLTGVASEDVREKVLTMHRRSEHKRKPAPIPVLPPDILC
ncbi:MAG: NAD(+) synthase [Firmicutes bacterium]|nr:NAD(+) synthase [Bacillota bacterium]